MSYAFSSFQRWSLDGRLSDHVKNVRALSASIGLIEFALPPGDISRPSIPDLVLGQIMGQGGQRLHGDFGAGRFKTVGTGGGFYVSTPGVANTFVTHDHLDARSIYFTASLWRPLIENDCRQDPLSDLKALHRGEFNSASLRSSMQRFSDLCAQEGPPSRLLAQSAGCEILAELYRLVEAPFVSVAGGLAPWAERRSIEMMRSRLAEDISLEDLAAEVRLSPYHFLRMFKKNVGVPPRVYLQHLRIERACALLEETDLSIAAIAREVGCSSAPVLARLFLKVRGVRPSEYRRMRRPTRHGRQDNGD